MRKKKYARIIKKKEGGTGWKGMRSGRGGRATVEDQAQSMEPLNRKDFTVSIPLLLQHTRSVSKWR